jgi:hypothetical protein
VIGNYVAAVLVLAMGALLLYMQWRIWWKRPRERDGPRPQPEPQPRGDGWWHGLVIVGVLLTVVGRFVLISVARQTGP